MHSFDFSMNCYFLILSVSYGITSFFLYSSLPFTYPWVYSSLGLYIPTEGNLAASLSFCLFKNSRGTDLKLPELNLPGGIFNKLLYFDETLSCGTIDVDLVVVAIFETSVLPLVSCLASPLFATTVWLS